MPAPKNTEKDKVATPAVAPVVEPAAPAASEGAPVVSTAPAAPTAPEGMVMVSQEDLSSVLSQVADLTKKVSEQNSMLLAIGDKGRIAQYEKTNASGELIRTVKIRKWLGKIVLGWQTVKDEVGVIDGKLVAEQIVRMFLENGEKEPENVDVQYIDFARNTQFEDVEILETSKGRTGESFTVRFEDGRELKIDTRFVN